MLQSLGRDSTLDSKRAGTQQHGQKTNAALRIFRLFQASFVCWQEWDDPAGETVTGVVLVPSHKGGSRA